MKFLHIASMLLAASVAGCGTLSVPGTPETATSLNGFRASHGLVSCARTVPSLRWPASTLRIWRGATVSITTAS